MINPADDSSYQELTRMRRRIGHCVLSPLPYLWTIFALSPIAGGQDPPRRIPDPTPATVGYKQMHWVGRGPWVGEVHLIQSHLGLVGNEALQEDLELTADQKARLAAVKVDPRPFGALHRDVLKISSLRKRGEADGEEYAEVEARVNFLYRKQEEAVRSILDPKQYKRLKEIAVQQGGPLIVTFPRFADRLRLADIQRERIAEILGESAEREKAAIDERLGYFPGLEFKPGQDISDPAFVALNEIHNKRGKVKDEIRHKNETQTIRDVMRVLTPQQRKALEKMKGEPYDLSKLTWEYAARVREEKAAKERKAASEGAPN
mgnify:CR=1 FL=1